MQHFPWRFVSLKKIILLFFLLKRSLKILNRIFLSKVCRRYQKIVKYFAKMQFNAVAWIGSHIAAFTCKILTLFRRMSPKYHISA